MMHRLVCPFLAALAFIASPAHGQSVQPTQAQAAKLYESLRDTINHGAEVFNQQADYAGCYRVFEGALLSIKPLASSNRAKEIDEALTKAARMARFEDKAYQLRTVLDAVREDFRVLARTKDEPKQETKKLPPIETKKPDETKKPKEAKKPVEVKKPAEVKKTPEPKPPVDEPKIKGIPLPEKIGPLEDEKKTTTQIMPKVGHVVGTVSVNGRPMQGGTLQLVAPVGEFVTKIDPNGEFVFPMMIPSGPFRVAVVPSQENLVAPRLRDENTSGLLIRVRPEKQTIELNLVK
ncbi:MAG: hypothetical protein U0744_19300 [Gemmataceae bacterium]